MSLLIRPLLYTSFRLSQISNIQITFQIIVAELTAVHMLRSLLQWRNKQNWLREMRKLKRELGSSPVAKQIDQVIADGYEHFAEQNREVIEEELELKKQRRD